MRVAQPRLHREDTSWMEFDTYAEEILALAQHDENGQLGTPLELKTRAQHGRYIVMKVSGTCFISWSLLLMSRHHF